MRAGMRIVQGTAGLVRRGGTKPELAEAAVHKHSRGGGRGESGYLFKNNIGTKTKAANPIRDRYSCVSNPENREGRELASPGQEVVSARVPTEHRAPVARDTL